ncbi:MAG: ACT domain-containing protein [Desulfobacterales bacterium]|nr:ACT domain-containing protein [Desulfobacterales bacterium]
MHVEQISVFLENTAGRLAEVTSILSENSINIRALSLADTSDFGVLRLIVDDIEKAETTLKNHGFTVGKNRVAAVEVEDRPGGLNDILQLLFEAGINVEYMYAFVRNSGDNAVMIFRFDQIDDALKLLEEKGVRAIGGSTLYTL